MESLREALSYGVLVFFVVAVCETVLRWRRGSSDSVRETAANLGIYAISRGWREYVTRGIEVAVLAAAYSVAPKKLPSELWTLPIALLAADFVYYWKHRLEHKVRILWAYHSVHHSSGEYNLSTALRLPWFGSVVQLLFYVPLAVLGLHPVAIVVARGLVLIYQFWIHTEAVGKLAGFDAVFNSPSNHRVHHGSNARYLDRNHGGILIVWDRLFGTYQAEDEKAVYGLTEAVTTRNPFKVNLHEPIRIWRDIRSAASLAQVLGHLLRGPGWTASNATPSAPDSLQPEIIARERTDLMKAKAR